MPAITSYLTSLESELHGDALTQDALTASMSRLYKLIERLMDEIFKAQDPDLKAMLAVLEKKARECLGEIRSRLAVFN